MHKKIVSLGVLLCWAGIASGAQLQDARIVAVKDGVNLVMDLDKAADYKLMTLTGPDRVVVDIIASKTDIELDKIDLSTAGPIKKIRHGVQNTNDLRLVLELEKALKPKVSVVKDAKGQRLTIEIPAEGIQAKAPVLAPVLAKKTESDEVKPAKATKPTNDRPVRTANRGRDIVVAVDAGHGGHDSGAVGPSGIREKDVVLEIARKVAGELNKLRGIRAVLTRSEDFFIPLRDRTRIARDNNVDMFISVHADAYRDQRAGGSSVFVLSDRGASSEMARWLAASENATELRNGASLGTKDDALKSVLLDLSQAGTIAESMDAAGRVLERLDRIGNLHRGFVEQAGFVVLKSLDIPSMLVETAFISNPTEEQKLNDAEFQLRLASAITEGVRDYFVAKPIPGTSLALGDGKEDHEHVIAEGDTLSTIAQKYRVSMDQLKSLNEIADGDMIVVGKVLRIPNDG